MFARRGGTDECGEWSCRRSRWGTASRQQPGRRSCRSKNGHGSVGQRKPLHVRVLDRSPRVPPTRCGTSWPTRLRPANARPAVRRHLWRPPQSVSARNGCHAPKNHASCPRTTPDTADQHKAETAICRGRSRSPQRLPETGRWHAVVCSRQSRAYETIQRTARVVGPVRPELHQHLGRWHRPDAGYRPTRLLGGRRDRFGRGAVVVLEFPANRADPQDKALMAQQAGDHVEQFAGTRVTLRAEHVRHTLR